MLNHKDKLLSCNNIKVNLQGQCAQTKSMQARLLPVYITGKLRYIILA